MLRCAGQTTSREQCERCGGHVICHRYQEVHDTLLRIDDEHLVCGMCLGEFFHAYADEVRFALEEFAKDRRSDRLVRAG